MHYLESPSNDIYFNLAAEEYFLKHHSDEFCMLWISHPAVVVGKHQNVFAEINLEMVLKKNVRMARRMTGGGTVFHDPGNLNFTFIRNGKEGEMINFNVHTRLVRGVLSSLGLKVDIQGQHSLTLDGLKISGNAEHVFKNRVLHHGTLLFSTNLIQLNETLKIESGKYIHKGVPSVPSRVTNISDHLRDPMSMEDFKLKVGDYILRHEPGSQKQHLTTEDQEAIGKLRDTKYANPEWIYGYAPRYAFRNRKLLKTGPLTVHMEVEKGRIQSLKLESEGIVSEVLRILEHACLQAPHDPDGLQNILVQTGRNHPGQGLEEPGFLLAFF